VFLYRVVVSSTRAAVARPGALPKDFAMPIYEYVCSTCGHRFEQIVRIGAEAPPCPSCASAEVVKKISASGFILKGGGWYKDHYGLKSGGGSSSSDGSSSTSSSSSSGSSDAASSGSSTTTTTTTTTTTAAK
jgi:putative FmdB family regulatory protein